MIRTWGFVTLTGTAQPVFCTTLASAFILKTDGQGNPLKGQTMALTSGVNFVKGDRLQILEANGSLGEFVHIETISGNSITVSPKYSHSSGAWVILAEALTSIYIQTAAGNAGIVGIGTSSAVALTGAAGNTLIMILAIPGASGQPPEFSSANIFGANPKSSEFYWAIGTSADLILPSFEVT